jgi:hypothetical protein
MAFDPVQRLLAIGSKCGSLRMYPFSLAFQIHIRIACCTTALIEE